MSSSQISLFGYCRYIHLQFGPHQIITSSYLFCPVCTNCFIWDNCSCFHDVDIGLVICHGNGDHSNTIASGHSNTAHLCHINLHFIIWIKPFKTTNSAPFICKLMLILFPCKCITGPISKPMIASTEYLFGSNPTVVLFHCRIWLNFDIQSWVLLKVTAVFVGYYVMVVIVHNARPILCVVLFSVDMYPWRQPPDNLVLNCRP